MTIPALKLNDGGKIPQIGLGTWKIPDGDAAKVVADAIAAGYRLIDTASEYGNERGVGAGLRAAPAPPDGFFLTTKVWNAHQGYDRTLRAAEESLARLGRPSIDLYLIHWPAPAQNLYVDTWRALIALRERGLARSIGVSNFQEAHLERIIGETGVVPAVNQIELNPQLSQRKLRAFHARHGIVTESWSPLARGNLLLHPDIVALALKHGKNAAQIILRWHIDAGLVVIPKSTSPTRLRENLALFDFSLDRDDLAVLDRLDTGRRLGPNPDTF
jgi:2,5-diketo-D-gluconate reductase A